MICRVWEKHVVDRTGTMPLAEAVARHLGGDWSELIAEQAWPELEELLNGSLRISRDTLQDQLVELAEDAARRRLEAVEEESASDEEIHELALDEVRLDAGDLAALKAHLGEQLLADALSLYGEALASRIAEGVSA